MRLATNNCRESLVPTSCGRSAAGESAGLVHEAVATLQGAAQASHRRNLFKGGCTVAKKKAAKKAKKKSSKKKK